MPYFDGSQDGLLITPIGLFLIPTTTTTTTTTTTYIIK
jgi:hypothetical protein